MCLVVLALGVFPEAPFVLAANRDEYFARPSAPAGWWSHDGVELFGGRDLDKGGTWLGLTRSGRVAVVTNVRDLKTPAREGASSRGWLVRDALASESFPPTFEPAKFPAYNVLAGEGSELFYLRDDAETMRVADGIHGLSNHRLDTPWPKVETAVRAMHGASPHDIDTLFRILRSDAVAGDDELPSTGVPKEVERALSPAFVRLGAVGYGTRCSTVVIQRPGGPIDFEERTWDEAGLLTGTVKQTIG